MANRTPSFAKRLLNKNVATLSTSQSTPSLPDLAIERQTMGFSTEMRRGHSSQQKTTEEPKQQK
jgi:hypothetical protein